MRVLLCALNAKYIHSNLAVHVLREYARFSLLCISGREEINRLNVPTGKCEFPTTQTIRPERNEHEAKKASLTLDKTSRGKEIEILVEEYTINQQFGEVLADIYQKQADMIFFSCYIWNISFVESLVIELKKLLPKVEIWLGGPEVSHNSAEILKKYPQLSGVIRGEGEEAFASLLRGDCLSEILGISYLDSRGKIIENGDSPSLDLNKIPFPYGNLEEFQNRIIYYESSRGCPFTCSYCLSSESSKVRFRDLEQVKAELKIFIDNAVPQVKFVDRTFNCNGKRAREIWKFLHENDNGKTNFHFEIAADLLGDEEFEVLRPLRQGLVQFEIGVQSTNPDTLREIDRTMDFTLVKEGVTKVKEMNNIHLHLDLIAGLPEENYESFKKSFDEVYQLKPEQLQLGFLKVLKGSVIEKKKESYELIASECPPYEVLSTKWLNYEEILKLKSLEEMLEIYHNSGQFVHSLEWLHTRFASPFSLYESLGEFAKEKDYGKKNHSREKRYEMLLDFVKESVASTEEFCGRLILDYYTRENPKKRPGFAGVEKLTKEEKSRFYEKEAIEFNFLKSHRGYNKNQLRKMTHLELINGSLYLFDYLNTNPWNKKAKILTLNVAGGKKE